MQYMLLVCHDDTFNPPDTMEAETTAWVAEVDGRGIRKTGSRLRPISDATTVRIRDGELLLSDGPFAETKEQVAGFDLLECADLDEALEVAAKHPMATWGTIEVRPLWSS
jgi:hypothetical protein